MLERSDPRTGEEAVAARIAAMRTDAGCEPILVSAKGGLLAFVRMAFPGLPCEYVYAKLEARDKDGRGIHWDAYTALLHERFPWIAVYNMSGANSIRLCALPRALQESYDHFIDAGHRDYSPEAYELRRCMAKQVMEDPTTEVASGLFFARNGLVLPQAQTGPYWVHDIVPRDRWEPGSYLKMAVPSKESGIQVLRGFGYRPISECLEERLNYLHPQYMAAGNFGVD